MPPFDQGLPEQAIPESPSLDRENKLLGFSMPLYNFTLLDYSLRRTSLNMAAQLHGMFFLAESQWPTNPDAPPPPPELTCYRRNLFQITGSVTLPRTLRYIMTDQGDRIPILAQELTVSATESVEGNPVRIISVPWKTPAGAATNTPEDKAEKEPPSIPLDTMAGSDLDADYASFPIHWKRLQFRIATANNGRRKELQQHFVIRLKILATLSTGAKISIAEAQSGAIIVRGRSPRNFQSRKDLPLSTSAGANRKSLGAGVSRTSTGESVPQTSQSKPAKSPDDVPQVVFQQYENQDPETATPELDDWKQLPQQTIPESLSTSDYNHSMMPPQLPQYTDHSPSESTTILPLTNPNLSATNPPVSLSFGSDDEGSPTPHSSRPSLPRAPTSNPSVSVTHTNKSRSAPILSPPPPTLQNPPKQRPRFNSQQASSSSSNQMISSSSTATKSTPKPSSFSGSSPTQNINPARLSLSTAPDQNGVDPANTLYEYFPLGLDDWMPPVDAVYRPHVVHHTGPMRKDGVGGAGAGTESDPGPGTLGRARSKRYFSADD
jgi:NDT80 / PhoG like DNA-binding  family